MDPQVKALSIECRSSTSRPKTSPRRFARLHLQSLQAQTSTGKVTYKKPALMRWDYENPSPGLSRRREGGAHDRGQTLTRGSINTNQLSVVTFLWEGQAGRRVQHSGPACKKCLGVLLELVPLVPDAIPVVRLELMPRRLGDRSTVVDPTAAKAITFSEMNNTVWAILSADAIPGTQIVDMTCWRTQPRTVSEFVIGWLCLVGVGCARLCRPQDAEIACNHRHWGYGSRSRGRGGGRLPAQVVLELASPMTTVTRALAQRRRSKLRSAFTVGAGFEELPVVRRRTPDVPLPPMLLLARSDRCV
jgi:hypothetical protein